MCKEYAAIQSQNMMGNIAAAGKSVTIKEEPVFALKKGRPGQHKKAWLKMKLKLKMVLGLWLKRINVSFVADLTFHMKEEDRAVQHGIKMFSLSKIRTFSVCL